MTDKWLKYFGIQPIQQNNKEEVSEAFDSDPQEPIERINRRCLITYPLSSVGAQRLNVYDASFTEKEKLDSIRTYENQCRTDVKPKLRCKKKKIENQKLKDLRRRKPGRTCYDALDTGVRKRVGPTLRTLALNFGLTSPHFRFCLSNKQKSARMRQLEFGLTKAARKLVLQTRPCRVIAKRLNHLVLEAYSRSCVVKVVRLNHEKTLSALTSQPQISMNRLTPDQIATGLIFPNETLRHNYLQVRLSRLDGILNCVRKICSCSGDFAVDIDSQSFSGGESQTMNNTSIRRSLSVDQDFQDPIFLIPESPPHQKLGLLEPEEIPLPDQFSTIPGDQESGDSYEIASLASSSATSVVQSSDTNANGNNSRRESSCSPPDRLIRSVSAPRKQLQLFRMASYPLSALEYFRCKTYKQAGEVSFLKENTMNDLSRHKKQKRESTLSCSSPRIKRQHRKCSMDFDSPMLTRRTSKTLTLGVMIYENRNRSGMC